MHPRCTVGSELTIKKIMFYLKYVCMSYKRELQAHMGAISFFFFFPVCGRMCVCMPNKLHIFKAF